MEEEEKEEEEKENEEGKAMEEVKAVVKRSKERGRGGGRVPRMACTFHAERPHPPQHCQASHIFIKHSYQTLAVLSE